jgi:hypothetical protein
VAQAYGDLALSAIILVVTSVYEADYCGLS